MRVEIVVPQIGEAVAELTLLSWFKQVGDEVKKGEVLFEIDSDKAIVEVEAFTDGTLSEILFPDDSSVLPQQVVAIIETEKVDTSSPTSSAPSLNTPSQPKEPQNGRKISPLAQRYANEHDINLDAIVGTGPGGRILIDDVRNLSPVNHQNDNQSGAPTIVQPINASPKARLLAKDLNVSLFGVVGTGVDGMIRVKDVEQATPQKVTSKVPTQPTLGGSDIELSKLRQTIAIRTQKSKQEIPHFYLMVDVDMTESNRLRAYCLERLGWEKAPTYTAILLRACALAMTAFPQANRSFSDNRLVQRDAVNIGVATNTEEGLVVPVIQNADQHGLQELSQSLRETAQRARDRRLRPTELGEKSMVISNLGMYAVDQFIAIIDMPDPMILAVGRVADRVVPIDGQIAIKPMCTLSLSVDHRVMDGVQGAQFLERIKDSLENPFEILNT